MVMGVEQWIGKDAEEADHDVNEILSWYLPERTEKYHENLS